MVEHMIVLQPCSDGGVFPPGADLSGPGHSRPSWPAAHCPQLQACVLLQLQCAAQYAIPAAPLAAVTALPLLPWCLADGCR